MCGTGWRWVNHAYNFCDILCLVYKFLCKSCYSTFISWWIFYILEKIYISCNFFAKNMNIMCQCECRYRIYIAKDLSETWAKNVRKRRIICYAYCIPDCCHRSSCINNIQGKRCKTWGEKHMRNLSSLPYPSVENITALKTKSCNDANFIITGGIRGCHYDILWSLHWHYKSQFPANDVIGIYQISGNAHFCSWIL